MPAPDWMGKFIVIALLAAFVIVTFSVAIGPWKGYACSWFEDSNMNKLVTDAREGIKKYYDTLNLGDCIKKVQLDTEQVKCGCDSNYDDEIKYLCVFMVNEDKPKCFMVGEVNVDLGEFKESGLTPGNYRIEVSPLNIRIQNKI